MADREKVIELFSSCISKGGWNNCTNCEHGKAQAVLTCKQLAEDVLKVLKEQNTVDHALEVLRQAGWKETQDVPFPAELLKEQTQIVRCKNCKYFQYKDYWADIGHGAKVLASDHCPTCNKWGNGCKTEPEGYCFLAERIQT